MSGELPFIDLNGLEIANAYRTLAYLQRGLGGVKWQAQVPYPCSVLAREVGGVGPFVSPIADPAPWYSAATPESAEFLGLIVKLDFQSLDVKRSISQRFGGIGGGVIGVEQFAARGITVKGMLIASSCAGLEYGRHWIYSKLGSDCAGCSLGTIRVRESCPPADGSNDTRGERIIYDAALVDGITRTDDPGESCCDYDGIEFTLAGQSPYLYGRAGAATAFADITQASIAPPSPTIIDTMIRANTGPPPSASWTGSTRPGEGNTLRILSNVLDNNTHTLGTIGSAHWNAATFGPDVAVSVVVPTRVNNGQFSIRARIVNPTLTTTTYVEAIVRFGAGAALDFTTIQRNGPTGTDSTFSMAGKTGRTFVTGDTFMLVCRGRSITLWRKPSASADWILEATAYDTVTPTIGNVGLAISEQGATQTLGAFGAQTLVNGAYPRDVQSILVPAVAVGITSPIVTVTSLAESPTLATYKSFDGVRIQRKPLLDGACSISDDFSVNNLSTKWALNTTNFNITGGKLKPLAVNGGNGRTIYRSTDGTIPNIVKVPGGRVEAKFTLGATLVSTSLGAWGVLLGNVFGAFLVAQNGGGTNTFALCFDGNGTPYQDSVAFTPIASRTYRIILEVNPVSPQWTYQVQAFLIDQSNPTQLACRSLSATFNSIGGNLISALAPSGLFTPGIQAYVADVNEAYDDFFLVDNSDSSSFIEVGGPRGTYVIDASRRVTEYTDSTGASYDASGYATSPIDTPLGWFDACSGEAASCLQLMADVVPSGASIPSASVAMQSRVR